MTGVEPTVGAVHSTQEAILCHTLEEATTGALDKGQPVCSEFVLTAVCDTIAVPKCACEIV